MTDDPDSTPPPPPSLAITSTAAVIGRKRDCDLVVADTKCSKRHATILREGDAFRLEDLDSQNGTFVNEERIASRVLDPGDRVRIGFSVYDFSVEPSEDGLKGVLRFLKRVKPAPESPEDAEAASGGSDAPATPGPDEAEAPVDSPNPLPGSPGEDQSPAHVPEVRAEKSVPVEPDTSPAEGRGEAQDVAPPEDGSPWMDAESGLPVTAGKTGGDPLDAPLGPASEIPGPAGLHEAERKAPEGSVPGSLLLVGGLSILCVFVFLFAEEIKSVFGVGTRTAGGGSDPEVEERVVIPGDAVSAEAADRIASEVAALKAELQRLAPLPERVRGMEGSVGAVRADFDRRMTSLEARQEGTLAEVRKLRADLRAVFAKLAEAAGARNAEKGPAAAKPREALSPDEKLFREVMDALESDDEKKDR